MILEGENCGSPNFVVLCGSCGGLWLRKNDGMSSKTLRLAGILEDLKLDNDDETGRLMPSLSSSFNNNIRKFSLLAPVDWRMGFLGDNMGGKGALLEGALSLSKGCCTFVKSALLLSLTVVLCFLN